eukprot:3086-Heterococcus_DN1.PRE.2
MHVLCMWPRREPSLENVQVLLSKARGEILGAEFLPITTVTRLQPFSNSFAHTKVLCKQRRPVFNAAARKDVKKKGSVVKCALLSATAPTRYSTYCSWQAFRAFLAESKAKKNCVAINEDWIIAACILLAAQQLIKQNISALIFICMNNSMSEGKLSSMPPASNAKQAQF